MKRREFVETVAGAAAVVAGPVAAKALAADAKPAQATQPGAGQRGPTVISKTAEGPRLMGPASNAWVSESNKVFDEEVAFQRKYIDPETGILSIRMTNEPCISTHIYPEAPISTPDGKRFVFARRLALDQRSTFWIGDIDMLTVRQITDEEHCSAPVVTPDGKWFIYSAGRQVKKMSPETFEREVIFETPADFERLGGIVSVDYSGTRFLASAVDKKGLHGLAVIEPFAGKAKIVYSHPDARNPHGQYSKNADRKVMIQVNNGMEVDKFGNIVKLVGEKGASLVVVNDDGTNPITLKAGFSLTERVQGHECWAGPKDLVLTTMHRRLTVSSPWIQDRVVAVVPGQEYRIVGQGRGFTHIGASPDGEWWISDDNRTGDVYIGSVKTALYKLVHRTGATFGAPQFTHPHPFFLGDGKSVGWNSDVTGVTQIYIARIPDGFLDDLK